MSRGIDSGSTMSCSASYSGRRYGSILSERRAGQEPEPLARLDRGPRQHDAVHLAVLQRLHGLGHREVRLAGAGGADAERDGVPVDRVDVVLLARRLGADGAAAAREDVEREDVGRPRRRRRREHRDGAGHDVGRQRRAARRPSRPARRPAATTSATSPTGPARRDLVAAHVDVDAGEAGLDGAQHLVAQTEQLDHRDVGRDADAVLDARGCPGGARCGCGLGHVLGVRRALLRSVVGVRVRHGCPGQTSTVYEPPPTGSAAQPQRPEPLGEQRERDRARRSRSAARADRAGRPARPRRSAARARSRRCRPRGRPRRGTRRASGSAVAAMASDASSCSTSATAAGRDDRARCARPGPGRRRASSTSGTRARRDCFAAARDGAEPARPALRGPVAAPDHDRALRLPRHDRVDADLGGRLDRHLVAVALGQRLHEHERDGGRRLDDALLRPGRARRPA